MTDGIRVKRGDMVRVKGVYIAEDTQRNVEIYLAAVGRVGIVNQVDRGWYSVTIDEKDYTFYPMMDKVVVLDEFIPVMQQALIDLRFSCSVSSGYYCLKPNEHRDHLVALTAVNDTIKICSKCLTEAMREAQEGRER